AAWRLQHRLGDALATLYADDFFVNLTFDKPVPLFDATAVRAELFKEQVGVVGQAGGHAPRNVAVEPGRETGAAGERGPGDRPVRRADVGQVPLDRHGREQVRVVTHDRPAGGGAARPDRPVV